MRPLERDLETVLVDLAKDFPLLSALVDQRRGGQRRLPLPEQDGAGGIAMPAGVAAVEPTEPAETPAEEEGAAPENVLPETEEPWSGFWNAGAKGPTESTSEGRDGRGAVRRVESSGRIPQLPPMTRLVLDRQIQLIRAMSPEQKLRASEALYAAAWDLKAAWIRSQHPELSEADIQDQVRRLFRDTGP